MVSKHHLKDALYILFLIFPSTLCFVNMNIDTVEPENGEKVILSASTNQTAVTWFFKGSQISYCLISTTSCIPAGADNMNFTVIATTSYVTISPYNCTKNDGVYLVTTLTDSDTLTLKSSIPVSSVTWGSSITTAPVESQELSVDIPCVYPTTSIQINFTVKTAGEADEVLQLSSNDIQTTGNAGCVCDAGSVSASYSISYPDKTVQVHVSVLHTLLTKKGFTTLDSQGNITFRGSSDGGKSGDEFWWIIVIVLLILILIILFCCFFNKRCRFRYVCADSKCAFTLPKRAIYIIRDENKCTKRLEGEEIEIQFLNRGKGTAVRLDLNIGNEVGKTEKNPCILFNPYILNKKFKKEHEGIYTYESKLNENRNCYGLTLLFQEDTFITDTSFVYWAHVGERLRLQYKDDNFSVHITKKNNKNENVTRIKSTSRRKGLVLNNISNEDTGSYQVISSDKTKKSGCLTLNIVNDHIRIGNRSESYVATVGSSIKLQSMQCETLNIKSVTWKKSLHSTGRDSTNADARDNKSCTSKYALALINVTKQHKGFYFCEIIYHDNQQKTKTSAFLKLDVVDEIVSVGMTSSTYTAMENNSIEIRHNGATVCEYVKFPARDCESNRVKPLSEQLVSPFVFDKISKSDEGEYRFVFDKISKSDEGEYRFQRSKDQATKSVLTMFVAELKEFGNKDDSHVTTKGNSIKLRFTGCKLSEIKCLTWEKSQKTKVLQIPYLKQTAMNELMLSKMTTEDEGSYCCLVTSADGQSFKSPTLTLNVVDDLVKVGEEAVFHVCQTNRSIILQYTGCLGKNVQTAEWRKSPQNAFEDANCTLKKELILSNLKKHDQGEYFCEVTYIDGYEVKSKRSGTVTLTFVDAIFNMDMKSTSCSAMSGNSIQIRCTSDTVPQHNVFKVAVSGTNQVAPPPKRTEGSSLLIEKISKEHEGCYHFESDDGKAKSGVLTLSVNEVTNSSSTVHIRSEQHQTFRQGAKPMLESITEIVNEGTTIKNKKKKKKRKMKKPAADIENDQTS